MDVVAWLEQVRKIDQLIDAKIAERDRLESIATDISAKPIDGMPFSAKGTVNRKVENAVIDIVMLGDELNRLIDYYVDYKAKVVDTLEQLPANEYGVLHRRYIRYMTWEKIAEDMGYSVQHVRRIRNRALATLSQIVSDQLGLIANINNSLT